MADKILIRKKNTVYDQLTCDPSIAQEISDHFTFVVPGYKFMPAYKFGWDGKIRMFNTKNNLLYCGLLDQLNSFCRDREYDIEYLDDYSKNEFSLVESTEFIDSLKLSLTPRDYQIKTFTNCVRNGRNLIVSPTGSGKSLMIYLLTRYYDSKTLIVVPTVSLVHQMYEDFQKYGFDSDKFVHKVFGGQDKKTSKSVIITTWQSIHRLDAEWFDDFDLIVGDEAHLFKAKSLTDILHKTVNTKYKFGFTGTLDGTLTNEMVLRGLFGSILQIVTTSDLIDKKVLSPFRIKCLVLKYPDADRKECARKDYKQEIDWIVDNKSRNNFIKNLALSLSGNTLILFNFVDKHGKPLYNLINSESKNKVYYVSGEVSGEERNEIRKIIENEDKSIIVASLGTFSTGIDITNLHNIIFASPSKSRVRVLQSIGRGLRNSPNKEVCTLFDVADDLIWKLRKNFTMDHFKQRVEIYNKEKFIYKIYNVRIGK